MALDLGNLTAGIVIDTTDAVAKLSELDTKIQGTTKNVQELDGTSIDVSPKGARGLDQAGKSAGDLSDQLDKAGAAAGKMKAPTQVTKGLSDAAGAADQLGKGLGDAAAASGKVKAPTGVAGSLDGAAKSASGLADELGRAKAQADQLGKGSGVGALDGALGGLMSTAKGILPQITAVAAAGTVIGKGWDRLTSIDSATFKLKGLGHESEAVADIMNSSLTSVKGTAFGLGDAATAAANAVASGVKPGQELTQVLTTMADTAAISGASLGDMGMIFNSVMAKGKLQGDDLLQLMGRGVPVLQMIGDHLGITAQQVSELATDGQISFEIFEAAMRDGVGGAAQEMGGSIEGSMMNAGAAIGRLGEAIMKVVAEEGPSAIAGFTGSIDLLTDGVNAAYGAWEKVPGPIKAVVGALVAAKVAQTLLNTEMGVGMRLKIADHFTTASTGIQLFASNLGDAYRHAAGATPQLDGMGRVMQGLAGSGGVAATAMGGLKNAAGGLLSALGGPWGLAIGGATIAIGAFLNHVQATKQAQQEAEASTKAWADVLTQAGGQINDAVQQQAIASVQNAEWSKSLSEVGLTATDAASAILDLDGAYQSQIDELDRLIIANGDYSRLRGEERDQAREYVQNLHEVRDGLVAQHEAYREGSAAASEAEEATGGLSQKVADLHRETSNAAGPFDVLNGMLAAAGAEAKTVDEAIKNLANAMLGLSDDPSLRLQGYLGQAAADMQKLGEQLGEGMGGFNIETGLFDHMDEQGRNLHNTMMTLRTSMYEASAAQYQLSQDMGASGVEAAAAAADAANGFTDALNDQLVAAGWSQEQIDALIEKYNMVPGDVMTHIEVAGLETANTLIQGLDERLTNIDTENHIITVDSSAITLTKEQAEELGYTWEDLGNNQIQLKADTENARNAIEDMATRTEHLGTADNTIVMRGDTVDLVNDLNEIEGLTAELVTNPAELPIVANTEEARRGIEELGLEAETLPDGNLMVHSNSPEEMQKLLDLGAQTVALPEGFINIGDTTPEVQEALRLLGIQTTTLPDGRVVITDNSKSVRDTINSNLSSRILNKAGTVTLNIVENVSRVFRRSTGGGIPERAVGGSIPKLAAGDRTHGGYRLPMAGPGTDRTDGILGTDFRGIPTAWVDRGEFVTNRAATSKWLRTLMAVNQDDPRAVLAAVLSDLPALASGGVLSADEIKAELGHMNGGRYVMGGFSESATDCSSGVAATVNTALGLPTFESRMSTVNEGQWLAAKGFKPGRGDDDDIVVGWYDYGGGANGHTSMRLQDGTYIESGGNTGQGFTIGPPAGSLDGRGYTQFMHLPYDGGAEGEDGFLTGDDGAVTSMGTRVSNVAQPRAEFHGLEKKDGVSGAGSTFGGGFNVPGLASNASNVSIGQSVGGAGQAAAMAAQHGYGAQADAFLNTRNPFVGPGTVRSTLGDPLSAHIVGLSRQLEEQLGRGGITAQVEDALNSSTPNWDVWLKVSPETIEAFNRLGEAEADRENSAYAVAEAERDLAEARKELGEVTEGDVELSTSMARKIADAEEAVTKARAGGKADKIADAEKKLARAREDANAELEKAGVKNAEEAQKATENLGKAQAKLTQEREKEERAIAELQAAQVQYQIAMAVAPVDAFMGIADVAVAGIEKLADSFQKLDAVIQSTNEVVERHGDAQIRAAESGYDAITASQRVVRQERQAREQRHADILAVQAAEFDLGMTRHEASKVAGAAEVDLSAIRQQGIWDVYQTAAVADQQAILSASQVAMMESALAVARAQAAYSDQQLTYESAMAQLDLEFAQRNAEIQAKALGIATRELAAIQGEAAGIAGYGASAMAKKTEGTATKAGGIMGLLGSIAKGGIGLALAAPTGGASLLLTAQAVAEGIGHVGSISRGDAQEKAWAEEAQKEFDALPDDVKAMIVAQQAGIPLAAAAGALMGAAGGSRDDVKMVQESVQGAFSVGLDVAIAKAEAELAAAEAQRQREERELAVLERQNRLDEINARLTLDQEAFNQENYLAELLAVAKEQHAELQQENKQLGQIHDAVSPKNQAVLMSIGGSGWGGDTGGASVADLRGGFGGLTGDMLNPYGSVGMEDQWVDADERARMVAPWLPSEEEWLAALGPIKDLPETVGDKLYMDTVGEVVVPAGPTPSEEARAQQMAESLSRAVADILLTQQGTNVETQFTGDVTISGAQATDTINALAEHLARA